MELGLNNHIWYGFGGPNSMMALYLDPLGTNAGALSETDKRLRHIPLLQAPIARNTLGSPSLMILA